MHKSSVFTIIAILCTSCTNVYPKYCSDLEKGLFQSQNNNLISFKAIKNPFFGVFQGYLCNGDTFYKVNFCFFKAQFSIECFEKTSDDTTELKGVSGYCEKEKFPIIELKDFHSNDFEPSKVPLTRDLIFNIKYFEEEEADDKINPFFCRKLNLKHENNEINFTSYGKVDGIFNGFSGDYNNPSLYYVFETPTSFTCYKPIDKRENFDPDTWPIEFKANYTCTSDSVNLELTYKKDDTYKDSYVLKENKEFDFDGLDETISKHESTFFD